MVQHKGNLLSCLHLILLILRINATTVLFALLITDSSSCSLKQASNWESFCLAFEREIFVSVRSFASVHKKRRWSDASELGSKNRQRMGEEGRVCAGCKFKAWGAGLRRISIGHVVQRQPAMVRSRRKIREGISVISSRRVMVRARFKAGAKNVSASQPPPSHHPHTDTHTHTQHPPPNPPLHEIEVKRQSRLFPLLLLSVKTTAGSLRTIFI